MCPFYDVALLFDDFPYTCGGGGGFGVSFWVGVRASVFSCLPLQSNKYAAECMGKMYQAWQTITVEELCAYMGFMVLMGIVRLPCIANYWKKVK